MLSNVNLFFLFVSFRVCLCKVCAYLCCVLVDVGTDVWFMTRPELNVSWCARFVVFTVEALFHSKVNYFFCIVSVRFTLIFVLFTYVLLCVGVYCVYSCAVVCLCIAELG